MALREYVSGRYKLPLFAGVRSATTAPPCSYDPANCIGSSVPGGIGTGDGGFNTPVDSTITKPTITYPADGAYDVGACDDATSSAFASSNGQTHIASRWFIQALDDAYDAPAGTWTVTNVPPVSGHTGSESDYTDSCNEWGQSWYDAVGPTGYGLNTFREWDVYPAGTAGFPTVAVQFRAGDNFGTYMTGNGYASYTPPGSASGPIVPIGYVYDSGADGSLLTALPLETLGLQPGRGYIIQVRHKGSNGGWSDFSDPVDFMMDTCAHQATDCSGLDLPCEDAGGDLPAVPPAPPPFPPPPAPPTPPAPPAPAPDVPSGYAQLQVDWAQSRVTPALGCAGAAGTFPEIDARGGSAWVSHAAEIIVMWQNLSATTTGSATMNVTADNGSLDFNEVPSQAPLDGDARSATITVPASSYREMIFLAYGPVGTYQVTLTSSLGSKTFTLNIEPGSCESEQPSGL